ncbi:hypothetical protein [Ralstonia mannitolilytica]|uniref:hypothetical protein n=1 Tax=Ralstonia mannitolilytica TaxID=105219 RepID=UPI001C971D6C|nr:hypothetical protein [Ralstonia mannitolilytica]MBY4717555.1 hypothetical protein [Ralstonia mannitolilytica]
MDKIMEMKIVEDEAISWFAPIYCFAPYKWLWTLVMKVGVIGTLFHHKDGGKVVGLIVQIFTILLVMALFMIPVCLYIRFPLFWIASIIRLIRGRGGKQGLGQNISFVAFFAFIFAFVYVPWIIPWTWGYVSWDSILQSLNIM